MNYTFNENTVSDLHKDAYGFRPTPEFSMLWDLSCDDQKQEIWDDMVATMEQAMNQEAVAESRAMKQFESTILGIMNGLQCIREHAIAIHLESLDLPEYVLLYGGESVCYHLGLPFSYASEFDVVISQHFTEFA